MRFIHIWNWNERENNIFVSHMFVFEHQRETSGSDSYIALPKEFLIEHHESYPKIYQPKMVIRMTTSSCFWCWSSDSTRRLRRPAKIIQKRFHFLLEKIKNFHFTSTMAIAMDK